MTTNHIRAKAEALAANILVDELLDLCRIRGFEVEIVQATYVITTRGPGNHVHVVAGTAKECLASLQEAADSHG